MRWGQEGSSAPRFRSATGRLSQITPMWMSLRMKTDNAETLMPLLGLSELCEICNNSGILFQGSPSLSITKSRRTLRETEFDENGTNTGDRDVIDITGNVHWKHGKKDKG